MNGREFHSRKSLSYQAWRVGHNFYADRSRPVGRALRGGFGRAGLPVVWTAALVQRSILRGGGLSFLSAAVKALGGAAITEDGGGIFERWLISAARRGGVMGAVPFFPGVAVVLGALLRLRCGIRLGGVSGFACSGRPCVTSFVPSSAVRRLSAGCP